MGHRRLLVGVVFALIVSSGCGGASPDSKDDRRAVEGFDPQMRSALEQTLEKQFENSGVPGVAATVLVNGRGEWSGARGMADVRSGREVTVQTPFAQGSITKLMVAALTLRLSERGALSLDDRLGRLVKRPPPGSSRLPLRRLLAQTGGLNDTPEATFKALFRRRGARWTVAQTLRGVRRVRAPGRFAYANANYLLLGQAIERAAGTSVADALHRELLNPLALDSIKLQPDERASREAAHGYAHPGGSETDVSDGSRYVPYTSVGRTAWTAGGVVASAQDMARFGQALFTGHVVTSQSLRAMVRFGEADFWDGYGLGVAQREIHGHRAWGHSGRIPGFASELWYLPDERMTIAVVVNDEEWPVEDTADELVYAAVEREPQ